MNFPTPSGGLYLYENFFGHYESEHRVTQSSDGEGIAARWEKKRSNLDNHMWDVRIYNMAVRDILVSLICKELKIVKGDWTDYVDAVLGKKK